MSSTSDVQEEMKCLFSSPDRINLLQILSDSPSQPSELATKSTHCRRSIQRNLSVLVEQGYVDRNEGKYCLTTKGRLILRYVSEMLANVRRIEQYEDGLVHLPLECPLPPSDGLDEMIITQSSIDEPVCARRQYEDFLQRAASLPGKAIMPVLNPWHTDVLVNWIESNRKFELIISEKDRPCLATLYSEVVANFDEQSIFVSSKTLTIASYIFEEKAMVGIFDESLRLVTCIICSNSQSMRWCNSVFETYEEFCKTAR